MGSDRESVADTIKKLLGDPSRRINLDDYVVTLLRDTIKIIETSDATPLPPQITAAIIQEKLEIYQDSIKGIVTAGILLGRWARSDHLPTLEKLLARLAEANRSGGGAAFWQGLRWYPLSLLIYSAGIAALSARNYPALRPLLLTMTGSGNRHFPPKPLIVNLIGNLSDIGDVFKLLPGRERELVPRSEHLLSFLKQPIDDLLFIGDSYEAIFDEFEIILALTYADLTKDSRGRVWAPPGRFVWKQRQGGQSPFDAFAQEAEAQKENWPPLREGLFGSSPARFAETAQGYREFMGQINW